jgi:phage baseplate assembly protein W
MPDNSFPFLGTGWAFPPVFEYNTATVTLVSGVKDIEESLNILLSTSLGERVMQPEYGCNLVSHVFDALDASVIGYLKDRVQTSILFYESRISVENISVTPAGSVDNLEGRFTIAVEYTIPNVNSRFNYVFDYYLNEAAQPI